ncbi:unnamed protein product [Ceratitis capitata]|uniref:(Mediterranean fruit fly) hypothetical protein n=1 Tax=Ceratitis capitata TaxID=7213 RepID=A0A811VBB5_CERCA|nr:unnamed protein product [Ceratitis capitata]
MLVSSSLEAKANAVIRILELGNGGKSMVTGVSVEWDGMTKSMEFLIVPDLQLEVYLGVNFWQVFGIKVLNSGVNVNSGSTIVADLVPAEDDLLFDPMQHKLNPDQRHTLESGQAEFPS